MSAIGQPPQPAQPHGDGGSRRTSAAPSGQPTSPRQNRVMMETGVTPYERFTGMLWALFIIVGFFAALLFFLWLTTVIRFRPKPTVVTAINDLKGRGAAAEGYARDIEEPGVEELPDVTEPQLSETIEAVTDAISSQKATSEAFAGDADAVGTGSGLGDSRGVGPGGEGDLDVVPDWERWQIQYSTTSLKAYASQLDFFKVELGALDPKTPRIDYVANLSLPTPRKRLGSRDEEARLYFIPQTNEIKQMDAQLLQKANISTQGKLQVQFYPPETHAQLLAAEKASLGGRSLAEVKRTIFGVRPSGANYEYFVIRHEFM